MRIFSDSTQHPSLIVCKLTFKIKPIQIISFLTNERRRSTQQVISILIFRQNKEQ